MIAVYIATKNDTNGNPRRGWIIFNATGDVAGFVDEGYLGTAALAEAGWGTVPRTAQRITVTPGEYLGWKRANLKKNRGRKRTSRRASRKRTSRRAR
jgi:hypothetical protein